MREILCTHCQEVLKCKGVIEMGEEPPRMVLKCVGCGYEVVDCILTAEEVTAAQNGELDRPIISVLLPVKGTDTDYTFHENKNEE